MRVGIIGTGRIGAFHAQTLAGLPHLEQVILFDADAQAAQRLGKEHGYRVAPDLAGLLAAVDAVVIASSTASHAELLRLTVRAGLPTLCEKPLALTLEETVALVAEVESSQVPVQVGFQRRFDAGYQHAQAAVAAGELGFVHTIRATTHDHSPPPEQYIGTSGGIFRDCSVHDFDAVRFVTGAEVRSVYGVGANKGADFFAAGGDVDTAAAVLTLEDDTLVTVTATRYNGGGHDVRMDVMGSLGTLGVGYDDSLAVRSAEGEVGYPRGPQKRTFLERFQPAYEAELAAFTEVARGTVKSRCTPRDALEAFRIAEACERSRSTGLPVSLAQVAGGR